MELSEEDLKAIESVNSMFGNITIEELIKDKNFNITIYSLGILDILRVIAIVDKLQKEIKDWFEIADNILRATNDYGNITIGDIPKYIENQQKELEEIKLDLEEMEKSNNHKLENWVHKYALNSYISKAKIRERIKKYNDYLKEEPMNIEKIEINAKISILKDLLEEN